MRDQRDDGNPIAVGSTSRDGGPPEPEAAMHDRELAEKLHDLLDLADLQSRDLETELEQLRDRFHDQVFVELIYLLCHLRFDPEEANAHWRGIVGHRRDLEQRSGSAVDLRVALVSYFLQVNRQFENPKVIELRVFEQTRASAYRDELTELYNYRFFNEHLAREAARSARTRSPLSLIMLDVDDFKQYNDARGHQSGNAALKRIARLLEGCVRKSDLVTRYGGEEFAVILPETDKLGAEGVAQRMREAVEAAEFERQELQPRGNLTVSLGVATQPADAAEPDDLIRCADRAMYAAKESGKNSVYLYCEDRRSHQRHQVELQGSVRVMGPYARPLTTLDISEGGMLFVTDRPLPNGTVVEVELKIPGTVQRVTLTGRVVSVRKEAPGHCEMGLRVTDLPRESRELLARFLDGDRREALAG